MFEKIRRDPIAIIVRKDGSFIPKEVRAQLLLGDVNEEEENTLVIPGIAQGGRIPDRIMRLVPGTDVASPFPYWEVPAEATSLKAFATAYPLAVIKAWREGYEDESAELVPNIVAQSEAAIGTVRAEQIHPENFGNIAYLQGVGLGIDYLGDTPERRFRNLGARGLRTTMQWDQNPLRDRWNAYSGGRVIRRMGRAGAMEQIKIGLSENVLPILVERVPLRHGQGKRTALVAGSRDKLTLPQEQALAQTTVGPEYLDLIEIDSSHSCMATKAGAKGLQIAVDYLTAPALGL